jgi:hypothetical protein
MAVFRRLFALAFVCLASLGGAQLPDQLAAAGVLGPQWKQVSRSAGMIFSGTVLKVEMQRAGKHRPVALVMIKFRVDRAIAGVRPGQVLTVREWAGAWPLHRAMRGGQRLLIFLYPPSRLGLTSPVGGPLGQLVLDSRGEIVNIGGPAPDIRSRRPPTRAEGTGKVDVPTPGAEAPDERNSLTAAVNRCATQNPDSSADCKARDERKFLKAALKRCSAQDPTLRAHCTAHAQFTIALRQLERAIRKARETASAAPAKNKE